MDLTIIHRHALTQNSVKSTSCYDLDPEYLHVGQDGSACVTCLLLFDIWAWRPAI